MRPCLQVKNAELEHLPSKDEILGLTPNIKSCSQSNLASRKYNILPRSLGPWDACVTHWLKELHVTFFQDHKMIYSASIAILEDGIQ